ncbi:hypothetical protein SK128_026010 [Halocaridina rubra]|uniref:CUB domain-containing protein n=1 Tax=Halocaridina rubra TaxID=373956 RepID=A0AAN8X345_HALRR
MASSWKKTVNTILHIYLHLITTREVKTEIIRGQTFYSVPFVAYSLELPLVVPGGSDISCAEKADALTDYNVVCFKNYTCELYQMGFKGISGTTIPCWTKSSYLPNMRAATTSASTSAAIVTTNTNLISTTQTEATSGPPTTAAPFNTTTTLPPITSECNGNKDISNPSGTLMVVSSGNYSDSMDCTWNLTAPLGYHFVFTWRMFQTEACCDKVKLTDQSNGQELGGGEFSGSTIPPSLESTGNNVLVNWYSDSSMTGMGFRLIFYATLPPITSECNGNKDVPNPSGTLMVVSSGNYSDFMDCTWNLTAPLGYHFVFTWSMFQTEECCDKVKLTDQSNGQELGGYDSRVKLCIFA